MTNKEFQNILFLFGAVVFGIVLFQNSHVVSVKFLFWRFSMSQIICILFFSLLGFTAGYIYGKKR